MKEWNILSKVVAATTDNGQNVISAVEKLELLNLPCVGHTLQLVVKHAFNVPSVSRILARIKRLVLHFCKSPKATYKLNDKQTLLGLKQESFKNECVTRWGSTYKMLATLLHQQQAICTVLLDSEKHSDKDLIATSQEFTVPEELLAILKPFNDTTEVVSSERYLTLSIVLPILHKLLHVKLKATDYDSHLVKEIKRVIRADLELRYQDKEIQMLRIATYLDPRFKSLSFLDEVEKLQLKLDVKQCISGAHQEGRWC